MADDIRIARWDLHASAGVTQRLRFVPSEPVTALAVHVGGTVTDVDDLTGTTAYEATIEDGEATVDLAVPTGASVPLRLVVEGAVVAVGRLTPSTSGTKAQTNTVTLVADERTYSLTVGGIVVYQGEGGPGGGEGTDGREVELQTSATHIQWRYVGDPAWTDLVALSAITGPAGDPGTPGDPGSDGEDGADGQDGADGREVELSTSATHIRWRYAGETAWADLVALEDLRGEPGRDGQDGTDATVTEAAVDAAGAAMKAANLADLADAAAARENLDVYSTGEVDDAIQNGTSDVVRTGDIGSTVQAHDSDLTAIAALTPSNDDLVQRKAGAWTNRTPAQVKADLALTKGDVGLGNVDNTSDANKPVSTAQQTALDAKANIAQSVNAQTGTSYTLVAADAGKLVTLSNASAITLTVPQDSAATLPVGTYVDLMQLGAGQVTVAAGTGATLRVSGLTAKARAQYARLGVQKVSANTWSLFGDLAAS